LLLETRALTKHFGGLSALRNVSLTVETGEIVGLIGPNGAGKTTVFNIITGIERPSSGEIYLKGLAIRKMKPHSICKLGIARTYQNVRPFLNHTVRENIAVGVSFGRGFGGVDTEKKIDEILLFLGLKDKHYLLAKNLPIEQRKLVEVGRALGANPELLLLDEPMAGLNPSEIIQFVKLMKSLQEKGITIVIVEHVMKAISSACSRVVVMHLGEIIASGSPQEVLSNKRVVDVYLGEAYSKQ
jgi:branched-chain amino acid transport system ATP-binding protein